LLGLGISATISQLAMTRAYRTGRTLTVASLAYSTVVFATLIGVFWWGEHLSWVEYVGMGLIMLSGIVSSRASSS
jgi:drug/metabolite transporter (DMT)-like permease